MTTDTELATRQALNIGKHDKAARKLYLAAMLAVLRPDERPFLAAMDAAAMQALDRSLCGLFMTQCNRELTAREEKRIAALKDKVRTLAGIYGLDAKISLYGITLSGDTLARVKGNPDELQVA